MTIVVWDGELNLVTDKLATDGSLKYPTTKAEYWQGNILSGVGAAFTIERHIRWFQAGADPKDYVYTKSPDYGSYFIAVTPEQGLLQFENSPHPIVRGWKACAYGEGRDFAYGALAMGATAEQAVEIANQYSLNCGFGCDVYTLIKAATGNL